MLRFILPIILIFITTTASAEETYAHSLNLNLLLSSEEIQEKVTEYGKILSEDYRDKKVTMVMIMKGAACFATDLFREMSIDISLDYIRCSSYGQNGTHKGELTISGVENLDIKGKHVLIVDDICDSGSTFLAVLEQLKKKNPQSLATVALLTRKESTAPYHPDYSLFAIDKEAFVVGYGLDYKERYRNLQGIYFFAKMPR